MIPQSANDVWINLVRDIYSLGKESSPRKLKIKELICKTTAVDMRVPIVSATRRRAGYRFMAAEAWWILSGRNDVASISTYSPHMSSFSNDGFNLDGAYGPKVVDQLRYVCDTLEADPESRQAVIEIWRPNPRESRDIPCTLSLQWMVREGKLHCIDTMRSSDAWLGWPYDVFSFSMLSAYILLMLSERERLNGGRLHTSYEYFQKMELGTLYLTAGSSHLYLNPKSDGATNIPYSVLDVEDVLDENLAAFQKMTDWTTPYKPLDIREFSGPRAFLDHLSLCKDRMGVKDWMREFQK